jgi:hypothetical protein
VGGDRCQVSFYLAANVNKVGALVNRRSLEVSFGDSKETVNFDANGKCFQSMGWVRTSRGAATIDSWALRIVGEERQIVLDSHHHYHHHHHPRLYQNHLLLLLRALGQ